MNRTPAIVIVAAFLLLLAGPSARAQQAEVAQPCARIVMPAERLACFDAAFPPPPDVRRAQQRHAADEFGKPASPGQSLHNPNVAVPDEVESRVRGIDYSVGGTRSIALENGQTWETAGSGGHVAVGAVVSLRKGALGGYLLSTKDGVTLRVRRVR